MNGWPNLVASMTDINQTTNIYYDYCQLFTDLWSNLLVIGQPGNDLCIWMHKAYYNLDLASNNV